MVGDPDTSRESCKRAVEPPIRPDMLLIGGTPPPAVSDTSGEVAWKLGLLSLPLGVKVSLMVGAGRGGGDKDVSTQTDRRSPILNRTMFH